MCNGEKEDFLTIILLLFVLPVIAAIDWDVSGIVNLSSMTEDENNVGSAVSYSVLLSSMEEDDELLTTGDTESREKCKKKNL